MHHDYDKIVLDSAAVISVLVAWEQPVALLLAIIFTALRIYVLLRDIRAGRKPSTSE